jgi:hypothetical protein
MLALATAAGIATEVSVGDAMAGTFTVYSCATPSGAKISSYAGWSAKEETTDPNAVMDLACPSYPLAATALTQSAHGRGTAIGLRWMAAAGTTIKSLELQVDNAAYADPGQQWRWELERGIFQQGGGRFLMRYCLDPYNACRSENGLFSLPEDWIQDRPATGFYVRVVCAADSAVNCPAGYPSAVRVERAKFVMEDVQLPRFVAGPSGALISGNGPIAGVAGVGFVAADAGGGLLRAVLTVDGVEKASKSFDTGDGQCATPFRQPAPCPASAGSSLTLDTRSIANGVHSIAVTLFDATGTNHVTHGPVSVDVENPPATPTTPTALRCGLTPDPSVKLRIARGPVFAGRTIRLSGAIDLAKYAQSAAWIVSDRPTDSAKRVAIDGQGRFRTRLRVLHPQSIRLLLDTLGVPEAICSPALAVPVRARSSIHVASRSLRNGQRLVMSGRLVGDSVPPAGKRLIIRVRGAGSRRWYRAGETRARVDGRWSWAYRFSRTTTRTVYIFRVRIPHSSGYPYGVGKSRSVRVVVSP